MTQNVLIQANIGSTIMALKLNIIIGSTRPGRVGPVVALLAAISKE